MTIIKCSCGRPDCKIHIHIDTGAVLNFSDKVGNITVMYLNRKSIIKLIKELRQAHLELSLRDAGYTGE